MNACFAKLCSFKTVNDPHHDWVCLQDHYPAVDREKVKVVMTHMVQAGRLQPVPNCPGLVRMGGVVRQLVDQEALPMHLHDDALTHEDDMQDAVIDEKASHNVKQSIDQHCSCTCIMTP